MSRISTIVEFFIGGAGDKSDFISTVIGSTGAITYARAYRQNLSPNIQTFYRGHEEENAMFLSIKNDWKNGRITVLNLTGHSWGGQAAMNLSNRLKKENIPVNELITLDPVSLLKKCKINNAKNWVNVYQEPSLLDYIAVVPLLGNAVAGIISGIGSLVGAVSINNTIATVGGQLGAEKGANNISTKLDHADARGMYIIARSKMDNIVMKRK